MNKLIFAFLLLISTILQAQVYNKENPFAHTFSIVAKDTQTGEMAAGVQSHWFATGTIVIWGKSGVGVVATQSFINPAYGPNGLKLMEMGMDAKSALNTLIELDEGRDVRQVAFLDVNGNTHAFTGESCIKYAGHSANVNYSVQANLMQNDNVIPAMKLAFEKSEGLPIAERVLLAMKAAQAAGGDLRGKQSAAIIVVGAEKTDKVWMDKKVDLRVDDHENPIQELERLLKVHTAYNHMNNGDLAIEHDDMKLAMEEYALAEKLMPENMEMKFWTAVTMANNGDMKGALVIFKTVFEANDNWRELARRLPASGLLTVTKKELSKILTL